MSIPTSSDGISVIITLDATTAERLADEIKRKLALARERQAEDPGIHWHEPAEDADEGTWIRYYAVTTMSTIIPGVQLQVFPDKRHKGCSGYCHY